MQKQWIFSAKTLETKSPAPKKMNISRNIPLFWHGNLKLFLHRRKVEDFLKKKIKKKSKKNIKKAKNVFTLHPLWKESETYEAMMI